MALHVGIAFKVEFSLKDYFRMNLHASITSRPWFHSKASKLHIGYFETTLHVGIAFKVGSSLKVT
jgi:hypothetical protein